MATSSAPCVGHIDKESYKKAVDDAVDFISGKSKDIDLETGDRSDWDCQWNNLEEYNEWTSEYLKLAFKQLKDNGSIYVCISWQNAHIIHNLLEKNGFTILSLTIKFSKAV